MLALNARLRVWVAAEPADFRCGIDGLARRVRQKLAQDPFSGGVFVFCNRRRTAVKLLVYDGQGFWLCQKRLSQGHYRFWPQASPGKLLAPHALAVLLSEATTPRPAESRSGERSPDLRERSPQTELPKAGRHPPQRGYRR
ncbi:MAG: IS66 family insertion sequence element accessory protein TnpB [Candidatus Accumulibacter sp.]|uniref:IS66 family insertion sequence element accessory protein TnpB n=1 Tax=Candidatus Accumulibacter proximus TaxID=2954385 RepID=A0A935PYE7_9PROT|nr:IS66 family insertion sequence element accessory protein TnpB [Candidatus Accumulibacter proximus]